MARPKRKPLDPVPLSADEERHVRDLHERLGGALDLAQVSALYVMSLGRPDANQRAPSSREQLGASKTLLDALVARPKAKPDEAEDGAVTYELVAPYGEHTCPACGHRFVKTSGPGTLADGDLNINAPADAAGEES